MCIRDSKNRDDGRRRFIGAQTMVVARGGDGHTEQVLIPVSYTHLAPAEQFNLTPGGTYWFDLSGENIPGMVNTGTSYGAVSVPDTTLHYVCLLYTSRCV